MIKNMQVSLYRQKLKRRGQKVLETKQLKKFALTDIILGVINTEKSHNMLRLVSKVKVPVLDKDGNKVREEKIWKSKAWNEFKKEVVKTETKEKETNKIVLKVMNGVNKNDVKEAVRKLYGVDVEKVNIIKVPYKNRARRGLVRRAYVKAVVTLKEWNKLSTLTEVK